ncbi:hypothetical protein QBC37DRAFT_427199 [Rhypophila decipiens]|uniref:Uncharacterized protein n=1 Tax=Rhypophila decipiens TaxID=261697 RepID=A0AAN6Y2A0_9PEZI|nr:hypothetical protein QBC37DRAFT_427199 [Rhypophila decipiens]
MTKRNLLICFDAFGTLFKPKRSVEEQYTLVAHKFGVGINPDGTNHFNSADVRSSFRAAFKSSAKEYPNYGRAVGMGATAWWTKVITDTFTPLLPQSQQRTPLPAGLAPALLHRFSSADGYQEPSPGLRTLFHRLRSISSDSTKASPFDQVIVGAITNSDDRVPDILTSFGLRVSPLRFGTGSREAREDPRTADDIDFTCISYDVGHEKPDTNIFEAAEGLAKGLTGLKKTATMESSNWVKIHVGDEYKHDVEGALGAGWIPVWIPEMDDQTGQGYKVPRPDSHYDVEGKDIDVVSLDASSIAGISLEDVLRDNSPSHDESKKLVIKCTSLEVLVDWLSERTK